MTGTEEEEEEEAEVDEEYVSSVPYPWILMVKISGSWDRSRLHKKRNPSENCGSEICLLFLGIEMDVCSSYPELVQFFFYYLIIIVGS